MREETSMNFAIYRTHETAYVDNIVSKLPKDAKIWILSGSQMDIMDDQRVQNVVCPSDIQFKSTEGRNWIVKWAKETIKTGILHIIDDRVKIKNDPVEFLKSTERLMDVFGLDSWFSTVMDKANYVFDKYNPLFRLRMDEPEYAKIIPGFLIFCSNANTMWYSFNLDAEIDKLLFDESYEVPMHYIIEFLSRRRNTKRTGSINFMNAYPTTEKEEGLFEEVKVDEPKITKETFMKEHKLFLEKVTDKNPDLDPELILSTIASVLGSKLPETPQNN